MLSATNLEIAITTWIGAMIEEEGAITAPHRLLADWIAATGDRFSLPEIGLDRDT